MDATRNEQDILRRVRRELYLTEGLSEMEDEALKALIRKILMRQNPEEDFSPERLRQYPQTL
ncbi:MAG: hypothetical protein J6T17_04750 [Clostridia bacterium]|nr:hypothetical protein [Clostridia bacterium]